MSDENFFRFNDEDLDLPLIKFSNKGCLNINFFDSWNGEIYNMIKKAKAKLWIFMQIYAIFFLFNYIIIIFNLFLIYK